MRRPGLISMRFLPAVLLLLSACTTPTTLMRSKPSLSGTLPGEHGILARCALLALEDNYATAWTYDLREFPQEDRTQLLVRSLGADTILVMDFLQKEAGDVTVRAWQQGMTIYDPRTVAWEAIQNCPPPKP